MLTSQRYTLLSLGLVIFIDAMGFGLAFPVLAPLFADVQHGILPASISAAWRDSLYGVAISIYTLMMLFGAPILGDISDKFGRKKVLLFSIIITSLTYFICALSIDIHSLALLIFSRALNGLLAGTQPIAQAAILDISQEKDKTKNLALITFAASIGVIIGPMISGLFSNSHWVSWFNYSTPFIVAGLVASANALCLCCYFKETFTPKKAAKLQLLKGLATFIAGFRNKSISRLSLIFCCIEISWGIYFQMISLYAEHVHHFNTTMLGHLMSYIGFSFAICLTVVIQLFLRIFNEKIIIHIGLLLVFIFTPLFTLSSSLWLLWACVLPVVAGNALAYTCGLTLFSQVADHDSQGQVMGIASSITAATFTLGGLIGGIATYLNINLPFWIAGLFGFLGFLLSLSLKVEKKFS